MRYVAGKNSLQMPSLSPARWKGFCSGTCLLRAGVSPLELSVLSGVLQISNAAIRAFTIILMETAD